MSGAQTSRCRTSPEQEMAVGHLECPLCLGLPDGHVHQCRNGHIFCAQCLHDQRNSGQPRSNDCSKCRVPLGEHIRCLSAEQTIAQLNTQCRHCNTSMTRGAAADHEPTCPDRWSKNPRWTICRARAWGCRWGDDGDKLAAHEGSCMYNAAFASRLLLHQVRLELGERPDHTWREEWVPLCKESDRLQAKVRPEEQYQSPEGESSVEKANPT